MQSTFTKVLSINQEHEYERKQAAIVLMLGTLTAQGAIDAIRMYQYTTPKPTFKLESIPENFED